MFFFDYGFFMFKWICFVKILLGWKWVIEVIGFELGIYLKFVGEWLCSL